MERQEVLEKIEVMLEFEYRTLKESVSLREIEEWDSLAFISFIAFADIQGKSITGQQLKQAKYVGDLVDLIVEQKNG